jgi:hypothetical protein
MSIGAIQPDAVPGGETLRMGEEPFVAWMVFAAVALGIVATINIIEGVAAIGKSRFFVAGAHYPFGDLRTWGWVLLIFGVLQMATAAGVLAKNQLARWAGVGFAALNSVAQLSLMPAYPLWALSMFTLDVVVIFGLTAHGERSYRAA